MPSTNHNLLCLSNKALPHEFQCRSFSGSSSSLQPPHSEGLLPANVSFLFQIDTTEPSMITLLLRLRSPLPLIQQKDRDHAPNGLVPRDPCIHGKHTAESRDSRKKHKAPIGSGPQTHTAFKPNLPFFFFFTSACIWIHSFVNLAQVTAIHKQIEQVV